MVMNRTETNEVPACSGSLVAGFVLAGLGFGLFCVTFKPLTHFMKSSNPEFSDVGVFIAGFLSLDAMGIAAAVLEAQFGVSALTPLGGLNRLATALNVLGLLFSAFMMVTNPASRLGTSALLATCLFGSVLIPVTMRFMDQRSPNSEKTGG